MTETDPKKMIFLKILACILLLAPAVACLIYYLALTLGFGDNVSAGIGAGLAVIATNRFVKSRKWVTWM